MLRVASVLIAIAVFVQLLRLHAEPSIADQQASLVFVQRAIDKGAAPRMQALFPEGFLFTHVLCGLAGTKLEARRALDAVSTPEGRGPFSATLDPPYGIFYAGWTTWLLGALVALDPNDTELVARFETSTSSIAAAFARSDSPFLAAYPGQAWPVDSSVAMAAVALHDRILPPKHGPLIARWVSAVKLRLDPQTGLVPHRADPVDGHPLEGARGTSQSIIQRFLPEIDPIFAAEQYSLFRERFVVRRLGFPGVREHVEDGPADVDSGPLVFGVSISATVVTRGAALVHGDETLALALFQTMEVFGLPITWDGARRYGFGALPVGDAFVAWSNGALPAQPDAPLTPWAWWWRLPAYGLSALALGLVAWLWRRS